MNILHGLNVAQKAAVTSSASVLQVLAPPGSGKTKTLTSRVAYLLAHEKYVPSNVICCTFTIKASREMRERLRGMISGDLESKLILGTFHSVCRRYLVTYGHLIGIPKNFGVADSDDSLGIIKRAVKRLNLSIDPKSARSRISHRKARGKRLEDIPRSAHKSIDAQEFATVFHEYEEALSSSNLLDYDDLLMRCVDLLKQHPECVSNIEALLIDEFQDTNIVQFELMKLLASAKRRITIVGDPDQSIYGFRSAEIENLKRMKAFYPETVVINLEENYRSASAVLKLAQEVIEQDTDRPQKRLKSTHKYGTLPVLRRLPNPHEEAQWIVSEIKRITRMAGGLVSHGDIAILLRSAFLSLLIEKALANSGIPYRMVGGRRFFDRVEVRILLDYLRTICHPDNTSAFLSVINTPARKIGDTTVKELVRVAERNKESVWSISQKVVRGKVILERKLNKPAEQGLNDLISLVKKARQRMESMKPEEAPGKLIELVINSLGYQSFLKKQYPDDHEERWENVKELLTQATDTSLHFNAPDEELPAIDGIEQEVSDGAQEVLSRFLANVVLSTEVEADEDGENKPRITISTIHSAKGLEWPVVFVPAVYEGSIPHSRAEDTDEERRLLYVAMTRAQALLYMTFPVMQSRDESESILSQFLTTQINPLVSQTGPVFHDRVVEDIASVLRRPSPSQEDLAKGQLAIKENESQLDDIWPEDGSHKRSFAPSDQDAVSFVLPKGQSLSDALRSSNPYNQRSNYSTLAHPGQPSAYLTTTMNNTSAFSTSSMTLGFTTASIHLQNMPQLKEETKTKPTLSKSVSDGGEHVPKKPKLIKSVPGQGSIASFFGGNNPKATTVTSSAFKQTLNTSKPTITVKSSIPVDLSSHRLGQGLSKMNAPRMVLNNVNRSHLSPGEKRGYGFLSDSSSLNHRNASEQSIANQGYSANSAIGSEVTKSASSFRAPIAVSNVCVNQVASIHDGSSTNNTKTSSFQSGNLIRLETLSPLNNMQGNMGMRAQTHVRKTLGVRRTMNGWENRKNQ